MIQELAEELPEHQSPRGNEFRAIPVEDRKLLARPLVMARSQVESTNANWQDRQFRNEIIKKKNAYFYYAGQLHIDMDQANWIWWSVVYDNPSPAERRELI